MASQPRNTAACRLGWEGGTAAVLELRSGLSDRDLHDLLRSDCDKIGIDVPLGWPEAFVEAVGSHRRGRPVRFTDLRQLTHRATDRVLGEQGRGWPLSVSTDRIAYPALRAARLLQLADRSGCGRVVEVYPALALRVWGLRHRGYKGASGLPGLRSLVAELEGALPGVELEDGCRRTLGRDANCADALVASLVARAAALGLCEEIPEEHLGAARREGWIAVPKAGSLAQLSRGKHP